MKRPSHWPLTILGSASSLFNLFLPILMSRRMSVTEVGEFKVFFLYLAAVPALSLGAGFTNGTYLWGSDPKFAREKIRTAYMLSLTAGGLATLVSGLGGFFLGWNSTAALFAFACAPAVAASIFEASLVAAGKVKQGALFSSGFEFLRLAVLVCALLTGQHVATLFLLHGFVTWLKLGAGGIMIGFISPRDPAFKRSRAPLLHYALPVSAAAIFDLLVLNADRYVLSALLSVSSFAIYSFGCLMVPPLFVFEQSVNQVLIPKLAATRRRARTASALFRAAQEDLLILLAPSAAGLIALADPLVRLLFTDTYRESAIFLQWYALYYVLSAIPQDVLARARGDSAWVLRTAILFGTLAICASYTGAKFFGALGALQAFVLMQAIRRAYGLWYFAREEKAPFRAIFPTSAAAVILGASVVAAFVAHAVASLVDRPAHAFLLGAAAFGPVYFGIVFSFRPRSVKRLLRLKGRR